MFDWIKSRFSGKKEESSPPPSKSAPSSSNWARDSDEEDRVEKEIRDSGCWEDHIKVVDCMSESKDWRKCQEELAQFRLCMAPKAKGKAAAGTNKATEAAN